MRSNTVGWLMLAPTILILGIFGIAPFIYVLYVAFHHWNPFGADPFMSYNGANNFRRLVFDDEFLASMDVDDVRVVQRRAWSPILGPRPQ